MSITYYYRGDIERWDSKRRSYVWKRGYSERGSSGGPLYPWLTKSECKDDARSQGQRAEFVEQE